MLVSSWKDQVGDLCETDKFVNDACIVPPTVSLVFGLAENNVQFELDNNLCWYVHNNRIRKHNPLEVPCSLEVKFRSDFQNSILTPSGATVLCCDKEYPIPFQKIPEIEVAFLRYKNDVLIADKMAIREISYKELYRAVINYLYRRGFVRERRGANILSKTPHAFHYQQKMTIEELCDLVYRLPHDFGLPTSLNQSHKVQLHTDLCKVDSPDTPFVEVLNDYIGLRDGLLCAKTLTFTPFEKVMNRMFMTRKTLEVTYTDLQGFQTPEFDSFLRAQFGEGSDLSNYFLFALGQTLLSPDADDRLSLCFNLQVPRLHDRQHVIIDKMLSVIHSERGVGHYHNDAQPSYIEKSDVALVIVDKLKRNHPLLCSAVTVCTPFLFISVSHDITINKAPMKVITLPLSRPIHRQYDDWIYRESPGILWNVLKAYNRRHDSDFMTTLFTASLTVEGFVSSICSS